MSRLFIRLLPFFSTNFFSGSILISTSGLPLNKLEWMSFIDLIGPAHDAVARPVVGAAGSATAHGP